jgi:hypothetical protein
MADRPFSTSEGTGKESNAALQVIDSLLQNAEQKKITDRQAYLILDALAGSDEPFLVARFPAFLAICARNGIELNIQDLFSRYWGTSPKKQNLEKLLLISSWIFKREQIQGPKNLDKIVASFTDKYSDLFSGDICQFSNGMRVSTKEMRDALKSFTFNRVDSTSLPDDISRPQPPELDTYLDRLFSPKQKELIFKKLRQTSFTKTEREYYSRIVRKKLMAIADPEIFKIATTLTQNKTAAPKQSIFLKSE